MEDNIEINEDDLIDRYVKDLTPIELDFLENEDNELNTCNKCEIIKAKKIPAKLVYMNPAYEIKMVGLKVPHKFTV